MAVLPVEDLSNAKGGVNFLQVTRHLVEEFKAKGMTVVSEQEVMSFLVRNRIRWLGYLDTYQILLAKDELGVDFILFGTVSQRQEDDSPAFGLALNLVRTRDARTVWSDSGGLSKADEQRLLGISEPGSTSDLLPLVARNVLASWPAELPVEGEPLSIVEIESVTLEPKYVRPGETVKCSIKLRSLDNEGPDPQVFIKAGNIVHLAMDSSYFPDYEAKSRNAPFNETKSSNAPFNETKSSNAPFNETKSSNAPFNETKSSNAPFNETKSSNVMFFEASWKGSEGRGDGYGLSSRNDLNLATASSDLRVLETIWGGSELDDRYPVSLFLNWPSGKQKEAFLGSYYVDKHSPEFTMVVKGKKIDGIVTFADEVVFFPQMQVSEPIARWEAMIADQAGVVHLYEEGFEMPPWFFWKGQKANYLSTVDEGIYKLTLTLWDRAGNMATSSELVAYRPTPPGLVLKMSEQGEEMTLDLDYDAETPLAYWRLEVRTEDGKLLKFADGEQLPASVKISLPASQEAGKTGCVVLLRDILGNKTKKKIDDLHNIPSLAEEDSKAEAVVSSDLWLAEF